MAGNTPSSALTSATDMCHTDHLLGNLGAAEQSWPLQLYGAYAQLFGGVPFSLAEFWVGSGLRLGLGSGLEVGLGSHTRLDGWLRV